MNYINVKLVGLILLISLNLFAQKSDLMYDTLSVNPSISFIFPDTFNNLYLRQLRNENSLDKLLHGRVHDMDKVLAVLDWTHHQWTHNGSNKPSKNDALTILKEAKEGKKFRCTEYGIVVTTALLAVNYKARVLGLRTKDSETAKSGAGHVLAEVWMPEFNKWVLIDGQFNMMPVLNGIPLNAVEFRSAIAQKKDFKLLDVNGEVKNSSRKRYLSFIYDYLYYIDSRFDQRMVASKELQLIEGKTALLLVPEGAKQPTIFQKKFPVDYALYTNSLRDFYKRP